MTDELRMRLVQAYDAIEDGHQDRAEEIILRTARGLQQPTADTNSTGRMLRLERGSDLLAEPDPGPTRYLVDGLIVDPAIAVVIGGWKVAKTYVQIELALAVVTGRACMRPPWVRPRLRAQS